MSISRQPEEILFLLDVEDQSTAQAFTQTITGISPPVEMEQSRLQDTAIVRLVMTEEFGLALVTY